MKKKTQLSRASDYITKTAVGILFFFAAAFNFSFGQCIPADTPVLSAYEIEICPGDTATFTITGNLNDDTAWEVFDYETNAIIGTTSSNTFSVVANAYMDLAIYGIGPCGGSGNGSIEVTMNRTYADTLIRKICPGDSILLFGNYETVPGYYIDSAQTVLGCDSVSIVNLVVNAPFVLQTVTPAQSFFCDSGTVTINSLSETDAFYYLRDDATDSIVDGPTSGTGGTISFDPGMVYTSTDYHVYTQRPSVGFKLNDPFDILYKYGPVLWGNNNRSMECWFKWNGDTSDIKVLLFNGATTGGANGYGIAMTAPGEIYLTFPNVGSLLSGYIPTPGEWTHVAATCSPTQLWKIYINGEVVNSGNIAADNPQSYSRFVIGNSTSFGSGMTFGGVIDEVRAWSTERTQAEIQENMNACLTGSETDLEAYVNFETGAIDLSPNGYELNNYNNVYTSIQHNSLWTDGIGACSCDAEMLNITSVVIGGSGTLSASASICDGNTYSFGTQTLNTAGIFTETFQAIGGCDSIVELTLNVTTVDVGVSVTGITLTANASGATYQWVDCNNGNSPIPGETGQSFTPTANGSYAVEITVNGCMETSACEDITTIGIDELSNSSWMSIYPNPNNGSFTIELGGNYVEEISVEVKNLLGQTVYSTKAETGKKFLVNLEGVSSGVYIVRVNSVHGQTSKQVIVH